MKVIPSILFILFLVFLVSCDKKSSSKFSGQKAIQQQIQALVSNADQDTLSFSQKKILLDSAITLSQKIGNNDLLLEASANKTVLYIYESPDSAKTYIDQLEKLALHAGSYSYQGYAASLTGDYYYDKSEFDRAYFNYKRSNTFYLHHRDSLRVGYNLIRMAEIHWKYNDYSGSEDIVTEALKYLKSAPDSTYLSQSYNLIGIAYYQNKNYDKSIEFYNKALELTKDSLAIIVLENNIASAYIDSGDEQGALKKLDSLLTSSVLDRHLDEKALVLNNIGYALFKKNKGDGLSELQQALRINDSLGINDQKIKNCLTIAEFFENTDRQKAISLVKKAVQLSRVSKGIDGELSGLKKLINLTDGEEAKKYSLEYLRLNDSITNVRTNAKNQFAKIKYDYSQELEQNFSLKAKTAENKLVIEKQKTTNTLLLSAFLLTAALIVFLYYILKGRHKREKLEEAYKVETRIAAKIHDELANDVYNTIAYTEHTDFSIPDNRVKLLDSLEDVYSRTRNISKENSGIDTGENYTAILKNMLGEYQLNARKIILAGIDSIHWNTVEESKKIVIYRILQELMVNMKKHSKASLVMVRFEFINRTIKIQYSDNGVGISDEKTIFRNGLKNAESRIKTVEGTITFDSNDSGGLKVMISCPV